MSDTPPIRVQALIERTSETTTTQTLSLRQDPSDKDATHGKTNPVTVTVPRGGGFQPGQTLALDITIIAQPALPPTQSP